MKKFFIALCLIPQFAFSASVILTLNSDHLAQLKLPGEITFESTNVFCEERGLTPQPWSAPRKQKIQPKVVSISGNSAVLEISTDPKKQDICKYKFSSYSVWSSDGSFFVSLDAATASNRSQLDAADLELTTNQNSLYAVDCVLKKNLSRACATYKDGVKKGYSSGNGARLTIDLKRLDAQREIRPSIEYKQHAE